MTITEPTLFDLDITRGTHRHSDKPTSVAAAKSVTPAHIERSELCRWIRDAVAAATPDGCIEWPFHRNESGYGRMKLDRRTRVATHIALELAGRPRPDRHLQALHSCDNPPCVNPHHLRWGTNRDNAMDRMERGPHVGRKGEAHSQSRLTDEDVRGIRARYAAGGVTTRQLGDEYGLHNTTVWAIIHRRIWGHVTDEETD